MLVYDHYFERIHSITLQYDFARKAIKGFIEKRDPFKDPPPTVPLSMLLGKDDRDEWVEKILRSMEDLKGGFPEKHKDLENTLAQNEIILIVAVFEDQMKAIHREVLRQRPSLLNPDREIKLGKLVALKEERVIEDEIEHAVRVLDRQSVQERAKAFEKLGLPWRDSQAVEMMTTLRNRILHENTDIRVSGLALSTARSAAITVPLLLYIKAESLYPNAFDSGVTVMRRARKSERKKRGGR